MERKSLRVLFVYLFNICCLFVFGYYLTPCIGLSSVDLNQAFHIRKCSADWNRKLLKQARITE